MEFAFLPAVLIVLLSVSTNVKGKLSYNYRCDIFDGKWVSDDSYPYYESSQCPFIEGQFDCRKNGRPDNGYTKYRWQPSGSCTLPRFNAVDFLKKMKGKRLMFVGDSLSVNQWQSLTCMLHVAVPKARYISERIEGLSNFTFPDYNVSVMLFRNAFLVDRVHETIGTVMWLDSINSSHIWGQMDVLVFDTWHWWLHVGRKQPWDWIVYGNTRVKDMDRLSAYEKALNTWAKWIDSNVDPTKTQVFFQGVSPDHSGALKAQNLTGVVPPEFAGLRHLKSLDLSRNCLSGSIPFQWAKMRLVDCTSFLFCLHTSFQHILTALCVFIKYRSSLMGNRLSGPFPLVITGITTLVNLYLTGNRLTGRVPGWILARNKNVDLSYNNFTVDDSSPIECPRGKTWLRATHLPLLNLVEFTHA